MKRVVLLPAIGDLLTIHKALGFAGVTSHHFCSFYTLHKSDIENLDSGAWKLRKGTEVIAAAEQWCQALTKKKLEFIFKKHGVRWSSLHQLLYRDPVQHTVLGIMHNWLEGVLQHHAQLKWGIGISSGADTAGHIIDHDMVIDLAGSDSEDEMLDEEILELQKESQIHNDISLNPVWRSDTHETVFDTSTILVSDGETDDSDFHMVTSDLESDDKEDNILLTACIFDAFSLSQIHHCIANTVIPTWTDRPPSNLGEKSHGKLKADQWLTLFTIFLPLILPELWSKNISQRNTALLKNFHDLVACTHIILLHETSSTMATSFGKHYLQYRKSSQLLFPNVSSHPNHHYAMHIPDLLQFWGPLIKLSEFPYERHNGLLQKIKTNKHLCEYIIFTISIFKTYISF